MKGAVLDRRLTRVSHPLGVVQPAVDGLQFVRQRLIRLPSGCLGR
jgi:hypothetical protein